MQLSCSMAYTLSVAEEQTKEYYGLIEYNFFFTV